MIATTQPAITWRRVVLLVALVFGLGATAYGVRKYRKEISLREALATGQAAYKNRQYTLAATELGRYLTSDRTNLEILRQFAKAQMQRRPQSNESLRGGVFALETIIRLQPGDAEASKTLVDMYLSVIPDPVEAERVARGWLTAVPDSAAAREALASALLAQDASKATEAEALLLEAIKIDPKRAHTANMLAVLNLTLHQKDARAACEPLDQVVALEPGSLAARLARIHFAYFTRRPDLVDADLAEAEKLEAPEPSLRIALANLLVTRGYVDRAKAQLALAEQAAPDEPTVYSAQCELAVYLRDPAGAAVADRALAAPLGERVFDVLPGAVEVYAMAGRAADARKCVERLRVAGAPQEIIHYTEGIIASAEDRHREASEAFEDVVRRSPKFAQAQLALGQSLLRLGHPRRALKPFEEFVRLSDKQNTGVVGIQVANARLELVRIYASLERWKDAVETALAAERFSPTLKTILASIEVQGLAARGGPGRPMDRAALDRLYGRLEQLAADWAKKPNVSVDLTKDLTYRLLLAKLTAWRGQVPEALKILEETAANPEHASAATQVMVDLASEAGDYDRALRENQKLLDAADDTTRPTLLARQAELRAAKGDVEQADGTWKELIAQASGPQRTAARMQYVQYLLRRDDVNAARALVCQVVQEDPNDSASRVLLLRLGPQEGCPARQELVDQLKRIEGENGINWRFWQARVWLDQDAWSDHRQRIETLLTEVLDRDPGRDDALAALGFYYERSGDIDRALARYRQAFETNPTNVAAGRQYLVLLERQKRINDIDRFLSTAPDDPVFRPFRVNVLINNGDFNQAASILEKQVAADPRDWRARVILSQLKALRGDPVAAEQLLNEAEAQSPDVPEVLIARVEFCLVRSDWTRAMELCNQVLAKGPNPQIQLLRAAVFAAKAEMKAAEDDIRHVMQLPEWQERAYQALARMWLDKGQVPEALARLREGLTALPRSLAIRRLLASLLMVGDDKQRQEATAIVEELLREVPDDEQSQILKADMLVRNNPAEAERIYQAVFKKNPSASEVAGRLAQLAMDRGQREAALGFVDAGLSARPRNLRLLFARLSLLAERGDSRAVSVAAEVAAAAQNVLNVRPNDQEAILAKARAGAVLNKRKEAITQLAEFLKRFGGGSELYAEARALLARFYIAEQDFARAEEVIADYARLAPADLRPIELKLFWHAEQKQWKELLGLLSDYRARHSTDVQITLTAARLLAGSGDKVLLEEAARLFADLTQRAPADAYLLASAGEVSFLLDRPDQTRALWEKALALRPTDLELRNNLAWLLCERLERPLEAEKLIADAVKAPLETRVYASLLDTWGMIQYRLGMSEKSKERLQQAQERFKECINHLNAGDSTRASARLHLGLTLSALGDAAESRRILTELRGDSRSWNLLSPGDQEKVDKHLQQLSGADPAPVSSGA
ncbi:MAG: tetratricopeptide repeat protein [Phycisphaerae bacterium]|jgi:tetratricopeptide (TPR) repeat protein